MDAVPTIIIVSFVSGAVFAAAVILIAVWPLPFRGDVIETPDEIGRAR